MTRTAIRGWLVLALAGAALSAQQPSPTSSAADVEPQAEWITPPRASGRVLVYRTHPLNTRNDTIARAIVAIGVGGRGASRTFALVRELAQRAGGAETLVVAPRFPSNDDYVCSDSLAENEINWGCQANRGWQAGGPSMAQPDVTTFDVADQVIRMLARKDLFPRLRRVVVAGHSAAGQYVTRYSLANRVDPVAGVAIAYAVANPASYAYPDERRPAARGAPSAGCSIFDDWPYGLRDRQGYAARLSEEELRSHLAGRQVTYLLGERDNFANAGFDASCAAMAQGASRLERGQTFAAHVNSTYGAKHAVVVVPGCGHDERCMFGAPAAAAVLFSER